MTFAHHILVPTDFSEAAEPALEAAASLARTQGARVTLLHVLDAFPFALGHVGLMPGGKSPPSEAEVEASVREALASALTDYFEGVQNTEARLVIAARPAEAIVDMSEECGADLIVMATHGRSGIEDMLIGSVTERVVRHARCMTLVVPSTAR